MFLFKPFTLDKKSLDEKADGLREGYGAAKPFPHAVIDNFFPEKVLCRILKEFPGPKSIPWIEFNTEKEKKLGSPSEDSFGPYTRNFLSQLNSGVFLEFLQKVTGIDRLIPDPYFTGGGLHQIERGGYLKIHADFNRHKKLDLHRRLNLLLYINKDWKESWGGHLELWNRDMSACERKILPLFNRAVIFTTSDYSFHGHPEPLNCPKGMTRKSLALYYYTAELAAENSEPHSTLWQPRPQEVF